MAKKRIPYTDSTGVAIDAAVAASHAAAHNAASHSDISETGPEIDAAAAAFDNDMTTAIFSTSGIVGLAAETDIEWLTLTGHGAFKMNFNGDGHEFIDCIVKIDGTDDIFICDGDEAYIIHVVFSKSVIIHFYNNGGIQHNRPACQAFGNYCNP